MNKKLFLKRAVSAALALVMTAACLPFSVFASNDSPSFSSEEANTLMKDTVPAGYDKTTNPYGYGVDHAFAMVEQNELLYLETYTNHITGKIADVGTASDLYNFVYSKRTASNSSLPNINLVDVSNCVLIQSASFDPDGIGRNDHAAYVGLNRRDKNVYLFVYDARDGKLCSSEIVGEMNWAFDSDGDLQIHGYDSNKYIDIVAGDFDNDGKDTLIIYVANSKKEIRRITDLDYYSANMMAGCFIKEYEYADGELTMLNRRENGPGYYQLGDKLLQDYYVDNYQTNLSGNKGVVDTINGSKDNTLANQFKKLTVDMVVGDFNGDRIDDLAVLSYCSGGTRIDPTPQIKIRYGKTGRREGLAFVDSLPDEKYSIDATTSSQWLSIYDGGLACGDINNDGCDDLVVAGAKAWKAVSGVSLPIAVRDSEFFAYSILLSNQNDGFIQSELKTMAANGWSENECITKFAVEAVAYNGANAAEYIFINGSLYTYNTATGELNKVSTSGFQFDEGLGGKEEYMRSVVVGNFDGNTAGREQIVFVASCRDNDDEYSFKKCMISGVYNNDKKDSKGNVTDYGNVTGFSTTISGWEPDKVDGGYKGTGAQVVLTACDRDQDGVIARYKGVSYAYSDPEVKAVMQAAPYFAELGDSANNETDYTITESYELEQSSSKNVSYSVGMSYSYGGLLAPFEVNISAGYSLEWSKTFSEALETEYAMTVKAQAYNTALVSRTPVFVYCYEVLDENGNWSDGTAMTVSIPQQPVYQQMSIEDYNSFADEYNGYMENKDNRAITKESDKTSSDDACYYRLEKINEAENWLDGNEGNPYMYNQMGWGALSALGAEQLSQNTIRLGYAGGLNEVSYSKSNIKSVSEDIAHGFYFNFSISFSVFGDGILFSHDIGFETSLSYSNGSGVSTTKTSSRGCIGAVNDIDGRGLSDDGIPASVYTQYGFDWTLGQWFRHLYGEEGNKTVFIGYSLSNINSPAPAVDDLEADLLQEDAVRLSWSKPQTQGRPDVEGYYIYAADNGRYTKVSELLPAETASYDLTSLKTNTTFNYVITSVCKVDGKTKESVWSNTATVTTAKRDYEVTYSADNAAYADIKVRHLGNVEVKSGDFITDGEVIKVAVTPKSDKYMIVSATLNADGEKTVFSPQSDGTISFVHVINSKVNISVKTKKRPVSSVIIYNESKGGSVTAVSSGEAVKSNDTVAEAVSFSAVPESGYCLFEWLVNDGTKTVHIPASGNTYSFEPTTGYYEVSPLFITEESFKSAKTVTVISVIGGNLIVTDAEGCQYIVPSSGKLPVLNGTALKFSAVPDSSHALVSWSNDASEKIGTEFEETVTSDICVGAVFAEVSALKLSESNVTLNVGDEFRLYKITNPADLAELPAVWSSDRLDVAKVDENGNVTAVNTGTATITVSTLDGTLKASCTVNVTRRVTGILLSETEVSLYPNTTLQLTAKALPLSASETELVWISANEAVVTVSNDGKLTAVGNGKTVVAVETKDKNFSEICTVTVSSPKLTAAKGVTADSGSMLVKGIPQKTSRLKKILKTQDASLTLTTSAVYYIGTGSTINIMSGSTVCESYTAVVYGDLNGDGVTDVLDASLCETAVNSFNEVFTPESDPYGAFEEAADFNGDGFCDIDDYSAIVNDALKA